MRLSLFLLPVLLVACAAPREAAPPPTAAVEVSAAHSPVGAWAFTMGDGGSTVAGTLRIDPDGGGRIEIPQQGIESDVREGALRADDGGFEWRGRLSAGMLGPVRFTMTGTVDGDRMEAENAVPGVGSFSLRGERQR